MNPFEDFGQQFAGRMSQALSDAREWLFNPGSPTERYSQEEWVRAIRAVAENWFSPNSGVHMGPIPAAAFSIFSGFGEFGSAIARNKVLKIALFTLGLTACVRGAVDAVEPGLPTPIDLDGDGTPDIDIPMGTVTPEHQEMNQPVMIETYTDQNLGISVMHMFNPDGSLFGIGIINDSSVTVGKDGTGGVDVTMRGHNFSSPNSYMTYDHGGEQGYTAGEALERGEMLSWLDNMNPTGDNADVVNQIRIALEDNPALSAEVHVNTILNVNGGTGLLNDMDLDIEVIVGGQSFVLNGALEPLTKTDVFSGFQIVSTDVNPDMIPDGDAVHFKLFPADWVDVGDGRLLPPGQAAVEVFNTNYDGLISVGADGMIQTSNGEVVEGLQFNIENGKLLLGGGTECDPNSIVVDGDSVTVRTVDGVVFSNVGGNWVMSESESGAVVSSDGHTSSIDGVPTATLESLKPEPTLPSEVISAVESAFAGVHVIGEHIQLPDGSIPGGLTVLENGNILVDGYDVDVDGQHLSIPAQTLGLEDFSFNSDGEFCRPAHCWDAEANQWVRENALSPDGVTETEHPLFTKMEVMAMWLAETLKIENPNWQDPNSPERTESQARSLEETGTRINSPDINILGMDYYLKTTTVYDSRLYIVDEYGNPVMNGGSVVEKPIRFMNYAELSTGQSVAIWIDPEGNKREIMIDDGLGDIGYFYENHVTPFKMTQAEYDAIMSSLTSA